MERGYLCGLLKVEFEVNLTRGTEDEDGLLLEVRSRVMVGCEGEDESAAGWDK